MQRHPRHSGTRLMRLRSGHCLGAIGLAVSVLCAVSGPTAAQTREGRVFTVGNYPVEARAANAVEAKDRAILEGQQAALRSLLKRIVPVSYYARIRKVDVSNAGDLIDGVAVRSERNSTTEYIASYDFTFQGEAVRRLLDAENIPFLDRQAPSITLVPIYIAPKGSPVPDGFEDVRGSDAWLYAWKGLDLANALTPVTLKVAGRAVSPDALKAVLGGDIGAIRTLAGEQRAETVMVAVLEPDVAQKKVTATIAGRDAVAPFVLRRTYRLEGSDLAYTAELAAVISLGVLEGRWKAINTRTAANAGPRAGAVRHQPAAGARQYPGPQVSGTTGQPIRISIEFRSMGEWQQISRQLSETPEVTDLDVEGLSGRGARVSLNYPGGPQDLATTLAEQGLVLRNGANGWVLGLR